MRSSRVGTYEGFTVPIANGYVRTSQYVKVRDGCLIAVDMLHPAADGKRLGGRRPTVVRGTGYRRAFRRSERVAYDASRIPLIEAYAIGSLITPYELAPVAKRLVDHGYVFVSVDTRGTGASFGWYDQPSTLQTGCDLADVIDWIAEQEWCDGKIGMWGRSWEASVQLMTAIAGTTNLTCLCPMAVGSQMESTWYNGLFAVGFRWPYNEMRKAQESDELAMPVDGPDGLSLRAEALANRPRYFPWPDRQALCEAYKDGSFATDWIERSREAGAPDDPALRRPRMAVEDAAAINACGAAVYWFEGWWDLNFINSAVSLYNALTVPKKLTIGPWTHSQFTLAQEPHRWFDFWLKGIDNGILSEPPVHYSVSTFVGVTDWRVVNRLPFAGTKPRKLFLSSPDPVDATRTGVLVEQTGKEHMVLYDADPALSTGLQTRTTYLWRSVQLNYGDMSRRLGRCLTFTSAPLTECIELTGVPTLRLGLAVSAHPAALFVTLEEVEPSGVSHYLTEGILNLDYRAELPVDEHQFGTTRHAVFPHEAQATIAHQRMEIVLDLLAVSRRVPEGHCLRITLGCADSDNYHVPKSDLPVKLTIWCGGITGASIELPVISGEQLPPLAEGTFLHDPMPYAFELELPTAASVSTPAISN